MAKQTRLIPEYFVNRRNTIRQALFTTLFAYFFINLYKPFGAREWYDVSWWLYSLVSGLLVTGGMLVVFISRLIMFLVKRYRKISVLYYIIMITCEIFFMGALYAILERIVLGDVRPFSSLLYITIQNTSLILLIPYMISLLYFAWREKKMSLDELIRQIRSKPHFIPFKDENDILRVTLKARDLIFLEASDNYVVIHYQAGEKVKTYLLRNTLKRIEMQLSDFPLLRCHRSFMVNIDQIKMLKREKGQFHLWMDEAGSLSVPVSRSYIKPVSEVLMKFFPGEL
jgi:hypothetical protein